MQDELIEPERQPQARPGDRMMAALAMPGLSHAQKIVLTALAFHDGPGGCRPTLETVGEECGMAARTVRGHVAALARQGVLIVQKGRRANRYLIGYGTALDRPITGQSGEGLDWPVTRRKTGRPPAAEPEEPELTPLGIPPARQGFILHEVPRQERRRTTQADRQRAFAAGLAKAVAKRRKAT